MMTKEEISEILLMKLLSYNNLTIQQAKEIPEYYSKFTWTEVQEKEFKDFAIRLCRSVLKMPKKWAEVEVALFNLNYGFKTVDKEDKNSEVD